MFSSPSLSGMRIKMYDAWKEMDLFRFNLIFAWGGFTDRASVLPSGGLSETFSFPFLWSFLPPHRPFTASIAAVVLLGALGQLAVCHIASSVVARPGHVGEWQAAFVHLLNLFGLPPLVGLDYLGLKVKKGIKSSACRKCVPHNNQRSKSLLVRDSAFPEQHLLVQTRQTILPQFQDVIVESSIWTLWRTDGHFWESHL